MVLTAVRLTSMRKPMAAIFHESSSLQSSSARWQKMAECRGLGVFIISLAAGRKHCQS